MKFDILILGKVVATVEAASRDAAIVAWGTSLERMVGEFTVKPHPSRAKPAPFEMILRGRREAAGLTQAEFAARIGVSKRTVEHWERGERLPPAERDAITRERLLASLTKKAAPGPSNDKGVPLVCGEKL